MRLAPQALALCSITILGGTTAAEDLFVVHGAPFDFLGSAVSGAGDVNDDGFADVIIGCPGHEVNSLESGCARVYSGVDGSLLHYFPGDWGDGFGVSVDGTGDVDGDGHDDLIVGGWVDDVHGHATGKAVVFSGADGTTLYSFYGTDAGHIFGYAVAGPGDVNGDGVPDFAVGAQNDDTIDHGRGSVRVLSGLDGSELYTIHGDASEDMFGGRLSGAGDVNGDGFADLIVGASGSDVNGSLCGMARVLSGIDGSTLYTFYGDDAGDGLGRAVSGAGDVNADGFDDVIAGAPSDDDNGPASGTATVYSGLDGSVLHKFIGYELEQILGTAVGAAGDVNGDGFDDVVLGAAFADDFLLNAGHIRIHSGLDGSLLFMAHGDSAGEWFGSALSGVEDTNGDGIPDLVVGSSRDVSAGTESGSARILSPTTPAPSTYCFGDGSETACPCGNTSAAGGCANSTGAGAVLSGSGSTSVASDDYVLTVSGIQPLTSAIIFVGIRPISVPFGDGLRCVGGNIRRFPIFQTDATGSADVGPGINTTVFVPAGSIGYYQVWYRDPTGPCASGVNTSNGLELPWTL